MSQKQWFSCLVPCLITTRAPFLLKESKVHAFRTNRAFFKARPSHLYYSFIDSLARTLNDVALPHLRTGGVSLNSLLFADDVVLCFKEMEVSPNGFNGCNVPKQKPELVLLILCPSHPSIHPGFLDYVFRSDLWKKNADVS